MDDLQRKILNLQGPILVLGASGFVGANLMRTLLRYRSDVFGTCSKLPAWRLDGLPEENVVLCDLMVPANIEVLLDRTRPLTIFDCVSYGAYSFQNDVDLIYRTNVNVAVNLMQRCVVKLYLVLLCKFVQKTKFFYVKKGLLKLVLLTLQLTQLRLVLSTV